MPACGRPARRQAPPGDGSLAASRLGGCRDHRDADTTDATGTSAAHSLGRESVHPLADEDERSVDVLGQSWSAEREGQVQLMEPSRCDEPSQGGVIEVGPNTDAFVAGSELAPETV